MKSTGKITILMIAVVAIGVFALPGVMSVGKGQHTFLNGSAVDCNKCHTNLGDKVTAEINAGTKNQYTTLGSAAGTVTIHAMDGTGIAASCKSCHTVTTGGSTKADHTGIKIQVSCMQCHGSYDDVVSGRFAADAHTEFVTSAKSTYGTGTYACMGCHTAVQIGGSPSYTYGPSKDVLGLTIGNNVAGP